MLLRGIIDIWSVHVENAVLHGVRYPSGRTVGGRCVLVQTHHSSDLRGVSEVLPAHSLLAIHIIDLLELVISVPVCLAL